MSPCCKSASDTTPAYYCFNELECACNTEVGKLLCSMKMGSDWSTDDVLSDVPGRAVACPAAKWNSSADSSESRSAHQHKHHHHRDYAAYWQHEEDKYRKEAEERYGPFARKGELGPTRW